MEKKVQFLTQFSIFVPFKQLHSKNTEGGCSAKRCGKGGERSNFGKNV